jgi:hypothetical protein
MLVCIAEDLRRLREYMDTGSIIDSQVRGEEIQISNVPVNPNIFHMTIPVYIVITNLYYSIILHY